MDDLLAAVAAGEMQAVEQGAHALRSAAGGVRALRLAEVLRRVEEPAGARDAQTARALLKDLQSEYERVVDYVEGYLGRGRGG